MTKKLTELLHIRYPILQGGMAWISDARLAAAVSEAGGAGVIATGGRDVEWSIREIRDAKNRTDKPFGVNLQAQSPNIGELVEAVCQERPAFVTVGAGDPSPFIPLLQAAGVKVFPVVPNTRLAQKMEERGADAVIVEGMESGGHIGVLTTMALMTQVIPAVGIPVIAAGGFADGRGLAAAIIMGAAGIQMGTRFLLAEECGVHPKVKERLQDAVDTDTVVTGETIDHRVRGLRNAFTDRFLALERHRISAAELDKMAAGTNRMAAVDGDVENGMVQAGQSLRLLRSVEPVAVIMETIIADAQKLLASAPGLL